MRRGMHMQMLQKWKFCVRCITVNPSILMKQTQEL